MIKEGRLRNALSPTPRVWIVDHKGNPRYAPAYKGSANSVLDMRDGGVTLRRHLYKAGWRVLEDECSADEYQAWVDYEQQCRVTGQKVPVPQGLPKILAISKQAPKTKAKAPPRDDA